MERLKVTVICFILCIWKCSAMSLNEIEDFKNFLEKTSQLDQILVKKGPTPDDDVDEKESISDDAWEESGKFEGDLILNDRQRRLIVEDVAEGLSRNGLNDITKRWPDNELVYYIQREHFNSDQVQAIQDGIDDLAQAACVKFRPYKRGDRDAVVIQGSRRGCFSNVGYQGGYQVLNLNGRHPPGRGCFRHGTIVHELLHSLGFYHMQSSPDRDDYINVKWENIHEPAKHNFRKYNTFSVSDFGVGYDYDSVLHYGRRAFSRNGQDTLVPKQSGVSIGQRLRLSDKDVQKLNKMYCDAESNSNDAAEKPPQKPASKKDNPKNKPFQGHGIGYHQGKTVVIKLPEAETIKLSNKPKFHPFDHFSKTPEAVPQTFTEGVGAGKEVTYEYNPVSYAQDYSTESEPYTTNKYRYETYSAEEYDTTSKPIVQDDKKLDDKLSQKHDSEQNKGSVSDSPKNHSSSHSGETSYEKADNYYSGKVADVVDEAFDRLGKIIKTHVYPSQTPDFDIYKTNLDYSKFYKPEKKIEIEDEIVKEEQSLKSNTENKNNSVEKDKNKEKENNEEPEFVLKKLEKEKESDKTGETPDTPYTYNNDHIPRGFDSSYGTSYPLRNMPKIKEEAFVTPDYATYEHLKNKHDYSDLYSSKHHDSIRKQKPKLFGYLVPLHDEFIDSADIKKDNEKYDRDTYSPDNGYENVSSKLINDDNDRKKINIFGRLPSNKKGYYSLFGVLVPLSQKWYKVDYDPHSGSYSIQKPESSEDYR